ncbi:MAG: hypothetical protein IIB28_05870 [Chloroflexi bacterium]|nr:hypothetical protein [Chloroflexota bacterium]
MCVSFFFNAKFSAIFDARWAALSSYYAFYSRPRVHEVMAALNRLRILLEDSDSIANAGKERRL